MRVGEMVLLNRDDINFAERECVVFGKGDKERIVYFDARAKLHLQEYLDSRTDDNPALFVTLRAPHERIQIGGIEHRLREMGKRLNIPKVHPHKFRRTLATMAIDSAYAHLSPCPVASIVTIRVCWIYQEGNENIRSMSNVKKLLSVKCFQAIVITL